MVMNVKKRTWMAWPAALLFAMTPISFAAAASMPKSAAGLPSVQLDSDFDAKDAQAASFIRQYCVLQVAAGPEETNTPAGCYFYTGADASNAAILAESQAMYQMLSADARQEVLRICSQHGFDYEKAVQDALKLLEGQKENTGSAEEAVQDPAEGTDSSAASEVQTPSAQPGFGQRTAQPAADAELAEENPAEVQDESNTPSADQPSVDDQGQPADSNDFSQIQEVDVPNTGVQMKALWKACDPVSGIGESQLREAVAAGGFGLSTSASLKQVQLQADVLGQKAVSDWMFAAKEGETSLLFAPVSGNDGSVAGLQVFDPMVYSYNLDAGKLFLAAVNTIMFETPVKAPAAAVPEEEKNSALDADSEKKEQAAVLKEQESRTPDVSPEESASSANLEAARKPADQEKAQSFVDTYCTYNGSIIKKADADTAKQILDGYDAWSRFDQSIKDQVNALLKNAGSVTFQSLYTQANQIRLGLPAASQEAKPDKTAPVQTAALSAAGLYIAGLAVAAAGLYSAKKHRDHLRK